MAPHARLACCLVFIALLARPSSAQTPTAALTGVVRDTTGARLDGAIVTARDIQAGYDYRTETAATGRYWLRGLPPATYEIDVTRMGYEAPAARVIVLSIGQTVALGFVLGRAPIELKPIDVAPVEPLISTSRSDVAYVVDHRMIESQPQETRRFKDLAALAPGATSNDPLGSVSLGALNSHSLGILLDGGDMTSGGNNELPADIPLLAIQEFEVVTTRYAPEFGRAASGVISAVTRRGTNTWKGEGFMLYRDKGLTARGAFEGFKPRFNRTHWGLALGGPLVRDRTHVFAALERRDENPYATVNAGGAFPGKEGTFKTPYTSTLLFGRLDHRAGDRHDLTLRYSSELSDELSGIGGRFAYEFGVDYKQWQHSVLFRDRWQLGGRTLNEARLHVMHWGYHMRPMQPGPALEYPSLTAGSFPYTADATETRVELREDLSTVLSGRSGTHRVKFGTHLSWVQGEMDGTQFRDGQFFFASDTASTPYLAYVSFHDGHAIAGGWLTAVYAQDDWNPIDNLTLNVGLRYDVEVGSANTGYSSPYADLLPFVSSEPRPVDTNNIGPRLGFAWDPRSSGRTVLRGGFGIFYDQQQTEFRYHETNPLLSTFVPNPSCACADSLNVDPTSIPPAIQVLDNKMKTPETHQFSLGVEQVLWGDVVGRIDGIYSRGYNIMVVRSMNIDTNPDPNIVAWRYPEFGPIYQYLNRGEAKAKILIAELRKAFSHGTARITYTLADRKITQDKWWGEWDPQIDHLDEDFSSELGPAAWDERHRVVATGEVRLPFGTGLGVAATYASGRPYNIVTGTDDNGDGFLTDRPPGVTRNSGRGPSVFQVDLGLTHTVVAGATELDLRVNVYNLLNRTNYDSRSINGNLLSPLFGQPQSAFPRRQVEMGITARF